MKPEIRRARCFRCQTVFGIELEVERLLAHVPQPEREIEEAPTQESIPPILEDIGLEELAIGPDDLSDLMSEEPVVTPEPGDTTAVDAVFGEDLPPSLTLGDLEGSEDEIMEKTLVLNAPEEASAATEAPAQPEPVPAAFQAEPTATGGFSSARDAISKLLGEAPAPEAHPERRSASRSSNQMDVEAALDALDNTLGGVARPAEFGTQPGIVPPQFMHMEPTPTAPPASHPVTTPAPAAEPDEQRHMTTTKLNHEELMAAMAAAANPPAPTPAPAPRPVMPPPAPAPIAVPMTDSSLYKVQLPKEVAQNLSIETMLTWIDQGHIQEFHMVARQQSENWIEAGKVPALRVAFDRLRRSNQMVAPTPVDTAPIKRGLFGGFFGRN